MASMPPPERSGRPATLTFVFVVVLVDMLAMGITLPVAPELIKELLGGDAARAAVCLGWFMALWAAMAFFASPIIGALSDRYGRRPVLLASMFGSAADFLIMALSPNTSWLFLGRMLSGITSSSVATATAYVADITPEDQRAKRFAILNLAFGIGMIGGPVLGGVLGQIDLRLPFFCAAALCAANGIYGAFAVPESLPRDHRSPFRLSLANPIGAVGLYASKRRLVVFALIWLFFYSSQQVIYSTAVPYISERYKWSPAMIGGGFVLLGAGSVIIQGAAVGPFTARFGEPVTLLIGLAAAAASLIVFGAAPTGGLFLSGVAIFALVGFVGPPLQAMMSREVSPLEQGRLQGANASVVAITAIGGPLFFTGLLAAAMRENLPLGLPFYVAAAFVAAALLVMLAAKDRLKVFSIVHNTPGGG